MCAIPPQQWLHERTSTLRSTYIAHLFFYSFLECIYIYISFKNVIISRLKEFLQSELLWCMFLAIQHVNISFLVWIRETN